MKLQRTEYAIEHQGKKYKPCVTENKGEYDVQTIMNDLGEPIIYHSLSKVKTEIQKHIKENPKRRFRFVKNMYYTGEWNEV